MTHTLGKKQATETTCESEQTSHFTDKDFKVAIIHMFNKLKESMIKEVRENVITVLHQIDSINKAI